VPGTVVVSGASGFVGAALVQKLGALRAVHACFRSAPAVPPDGAEGMVVGDLDGSTDWRQALRGADAVVHTAAHAHQLGATSEADYRRVNAEGTVNLARQAAEAGVRRFVFVSSVKVNGESAPPDRPYREADEPAPEDAYGRSKLAAEQGLAEVARQGGLEIVVLRPPLVYGPGAKGNLARLMGIVARGIPLPFGALRNRRSMVSLGNLCDAIVASLDFPAPTPRTYLLADGEDLSTPDLVRRLARVMERRAILFPVPAAALRLAGALVGRSGEVERLTGSLCVDAGLITRETGWAPSNDRAAAELDAMAAAFVSSRMRMG